MGADRDIGELAVEDRKLCADLRLDTAQILVHRRCHIGADKECALIGVPELFVEMHDLTCNDIEPATGKYMLLDRGVQNVLILLRRR